jgi:DNA ligase-1
MSFPTGFKPMLAATLVNAEDAHKLKFPAYVSPKIDGIRCITNSVGEPITRNGKLIMNRQIVAEFNKYKIPYLDGELGVGDPTSPEFFNQTSSLVRTIERDFESIDYYVFDRVRNGGYEERFIHNLPTFPSDSKIKFQVLEQRKVTDDEGVTGWEDLWHSRGYEGIIIRSKFESAYKFGRSTLNSAELIKCKRFVDDEMVITGFIEAMENLNQVTTDEWGHTKRSSHKENKVGKGMVGVIVGTCLNFDGEVRLGTGIGLTHELKTRMWNNKNYYIGQTVTFCYQANTDYEKVRFGSFKGFRNDGI